MPFPYLALFYHNIIFLSRGDFLSISEAQKRAVAKYNAKNYDDLKIRISKGKKAIIQSAAIKSGKSVNSYVKEAVEDKIKSDTGEDVEL